MALLIVNNNFIFTPFCIFSGANRKLPSQKKAELYLWLLRLEKFLHQKKKKLNGLNDILIKIVTNSHLPNKKMKKFVNFLKRFEFYTVMDIFF